jgi:phage terminase large subunit-like protein
MIDIALKYAQEVIDGTEIAPREVRVQCEWFLADLEKQKSDDFLYYFDEDEVGKIEEILSLLVFPTGFKAGEPMLENMAPFQIFFLVNIFGWRFKSDPGRFKNRDVTLFIPRKNGKTQIVGLIFIILLLTEQDFSEFYSICLDRELAGEVKKAMTQIIQASASIEKHFKISTTLQGKIVCKLTSSFYQARTSEANRNNSIRPAGYIADEFGAMTDYSNVTAMQSGQLNVPNPLRFKITTAYAEDKSIMLEELAYIRKVFSGSIKDERMFALVFYAEKDHLWDDVGLYQANPLRIEANYNEIRDNRQEAIEKPAKREEYLTKHMNYFLPSSSGEAYVDVEEVRKGKLDSFDWTGRPVWIGLDLSLTNDNTSFSMVTEEDGKIYCDSYAFVPRDRVDEKNRLEKINYYDFMKGEDPKCFSCGDATIDYGFVEEALFNIEEKFGVVIQGFAYDRYNALAIAQHLDRAGYRVVEAKQHSSVLHPATKLLREKILSHEFFYTENPLLEINFQNARCVENNNLDLYVNKKKSTGKVDMVVGTINALYLCQQDVVFNPDMDWGAQVI